MVEFLTTLYNKNLGYSSINCARSAIASLNFEGQDTLYHNIVNRFLKGIFNMRPSLPRYTVSWDPDIVLKFLESWYPHGNLNLKDLTLKTAMLLVLLSGRRGNTLVKLYRGNVCFMENEVRIPISELSKTSKIGRHEPEIVISQFANEKLCLVRLLKLYIEKTDMFRNSSSNLLISFAKPHNSITTNTLGRWIRAIMQLAGVDTNRFKPHSTRSATTSKAARNNISLSTILASIGWKTESTFARHYNKPIAADMGQVSKVMELGQ